MPRHDDVRRLGQPRPRRLDPHHPPSTGRRDQRRDTGDVYSAGESEQIVDLAVDGEETLSALTDLVRQGKVRYIGSSSYSGSQIIEAQWVARDRGLERFRTEQPPYSMLVRGIELDVLPAAHRHDMGILTR